MSLDELGIPTQETRAQRGENPEEDTRTHMRRTWYLRDEAQQRPL